MAKIIIALALLVAVAAASFLHVESVSLMNSRTRSLGVCRRQQCVNEGAVCDSNIFLNVSASTTERWCKDGDYCKVANGADATGLCTEYAEVGQACTSGAECAGDMECVNKFCNRGYLPGAKCSNSNDCLHFAENGDVSVACNAGRCAGIALGAKCSAANPTQTCLPPNVCGTDGTCIAALGAGGKCAADPHCQIGFYCNNASCTARVAANAACDLEFRNDDQCPFKYACVPNAQTGADALKGTCKESFTGASGAICLADTDCGENLACLEKASGSTNSYRSCGPAVASTRRACNATSGADNTNVCAANEGCVCNENTGAGACYTNTIRVIAKGAKKAANSAIDCGAKCARTDWNCLEKCEGKICSYTRKIYSIKDNFLSNRLDCAVDKFKTQLIPGYVECSSGSFVQFSLFGLVAIVAAMLL